MSNRLLGNEIISYSANSITYDNTENQWEIISPKGNSEWGYGFRINYEENNVTFQFGQSYIFACDIWVPTQHQIRIDYNNGRIDGGTPWSSSGNDNDLVSARGSDYATIPAETWTRIYLSTKNQDSANSSHATLEDSSTIGLLTSGDSGPVTWYVRNFYWDIIDETKKINISKNGILSAKNFLETNDLITARTIHFYNLEKQIECSQIIEY